MWRSCLWGSQLGSSSAVLSQLTGSWRGCGEVLEGPGRLPSLREPNWNSVYLTADTPLCLFLSVSLNPFLYFWLSRFFENKNTDALLPVSFFLLFLIYMHTPYLKHTVTYRRCLSNIFFLSRFLSLLFRTCSLISWLMCRRQQLLSAHPAPFFT